MSGDCAFCGIVANNINERWIVRHGDIISFKPFGATSPQHRLFVPIQHVADAAENPALTGRLFEKAAQWAKAGEPFNLIINSGVAAGQRVFHLHVHYLPRHTGDGLGFNWKA